MAKKRRTKKRRATFAETPVTQGLEDQDHTQQQAPLVEGPPSEMANGCAARSSVLSTEGKSSDGRFSSGRQSEEGTYTEMTSAAGSDDAGESLGGVLRRGHGYGNEEEDDDMSEGHSAYGAPSEYPTVAQKHRSEMPYGTGQDQDVDM